MKKIFIIRHAKSDQSFFGSDFDRPLNKRGIHDAPVMAQRLIDKKMIPEALVASPAKRATQTAEYFAEEMGKSATDITFIPELYHAPANVFYEVIAGLPEQINSVAIFSHNPGITDFVNSLRTKVETDNMPTCAVFAVEADIKTWQLFAEAKKEFLFFDYPKLIK